ncbi:DUF5681 domain-containing protein [Mesorhizobium sp. A556]
MNEDTKFQPGKSGNPNGRPQGSRSRKLVALDALAEGEVEAIVRAMIEKAKEGDAVAARPILDRVWPARKGARVPFQLPKVTKAEDLPTAFAAVIDQVAVGELSLDEGTLIAGLLDVHRRTFETSELAERLTALEEKLGANR